MTLDIIGSRLHNQLLSQTKFTQPSQIVAWLGAVQSQDYAGAKWAVAQRTKGLTDAAVEQAFTNGEILRTHVMRPTWHFVTPEDIRWMLKLTAPRVHAASAYQYRTLELDSALFKRSHTFLEKALQGGKYLTREELTAALKQGGISKGSLLRFTYIIGSAETEGLICSGPRRGKQFTYALLEERVPPGRSLEREEALAELARRYFTSHGPATLQDFVWWSGLTVADAKSGLEMIKSQLVNEVLRDQTYWFKEANEYKKEKSPGVHLLPNYDEYTVGYTDRAEIFDTTHTNKLDSRGSILFQYVIVMDGRVAGTWKRTIKKNEVQIEVVRFSTLTDEQNQAIITAAQQYGKFLGLPVVFRS
jgi:hypothetical protein